MKNLGEREWGGGVGWGVGWGYVTQNQISPDFRLPEVGLSWGVGEDVQVLNI